MIQKLKSKFRRSKLMVKITLVCFGFIFFPMLLINLIFLFTSLRESFQNVNASILEIVRTNDNSIDSQLARVSSIMNTIAIDKEFLKLFEQLDFADKYELYQTDKKVQQYLSKNFRNNQVLSAYIVTKHYTFGTGIEQPMYYPYKEFYTSEIYQTILDSKSTITWISPYNFTETLQQPQLSNTPLPYQNLFSAARKIYNTYYDEQKGKKVAAFDLGVDMYLIINFSQSLFPKYFANSVPFDSSRYIVTDQDGKIVYGTVENKNEEFVSQTTTDPVLLEHSGFKTVKIQNKTYLLYYDQFETTGWSTYLYIPYQDLFTTTLAFPVLLTLCGILILAFSLYLSKHFFQKILAPLSNLSHCFDRAGKGEFQTIENSGETDEVGILIDKFNEMSRNIKNLIQQNYQTKINEKEAHISALTLQLNPHFLYNSLNTINWVAIMNDQKEISECIVSLSNMLKYTVTDQTQTVKLRQDLEWIKDYIFLMKKRYNDIFTVEYKIEKEILDCVVPKLFLQPIIENSIIHAFNDIEQGGVIKIIGFRQAKSIIFQVIDNGIGMNAQTIEKVLCSESPTSIGIPNIVTRIRLIYGEESSVIITSRKGETITQINLRGSGESPY